MPMRRRDRQLELRLVADADAIVRRSRVAGLQYALLDRRRPHTSRASLSGAIHRGGDPLARQAGYQGVMEAANAHAPILH
jgi:crotonobetainyl-CoA:carnitine CoA-transferase CaiB-like acyl-CoA transferase